MTRNITTRITSLPLARPFRIAHGVVAAIDVVTVELWEANCIGRGECRPYARYGETAASVLAAINAAADAVRHGVDRAALQSIMPPGAARNAVDCALWDLEARLAGTSVAALAGIVIPDRIATAMTIAIGCPDAMAAVARALANVPLIKVKLDGDDPAGRLRAVRAAAPRPTMIVDANEGWTPALLADMMPVLADLRIAMIEQPLPAGADDVLGAIPPLVPVGADEAFHTAADVARMAGRYAWVNIKLDKAGGLTAALAAQAAARAAGLNILAGCMVSSSLAIAPAFVVAAGADLADLDGPHWLASDVAGGMTIDGGQARAPARALWGG